MIYNVTAKREGDSIEYDVNAADIKAALAAARTEANRVYGYEGMGNCAKVFVKLDKKAGKRGK